MMRKSKRHVKPKTVFDPSETTSSMDITKDEKEIEDFKVEDFIGPYDIGDYIFLFYLLLCETYCPHSTAERENS